MSQLIAFEGIDGAGKSTQIPRLQKWIEAHYRARVVVTAEPTRGEYGAQIRSAKTRLAPVAERDLFRFDRREHVEKVIKPALIKQHHIGTRLFGLHQIQCFVVFYAQFVFQNRYIIVEINIRHDCAPVLPSFCVTQ